MKMNWMRVKLILTIMTVLLLQLLSTYGAENSDSGTKAEVSGTRTDVDAKEGRSVRENVKSHGDKATSESAKDRSRKPAGKNMTKEPREKVDGFTGSVCTGSNKPTWCD